MAQSLHQRGLQRWDNNDASRWIFLLNHASRRIFSPITRHVQSSKFIANFTFSTGKASLTEKLCRFNHINASANMLSSRENVPYDIRSNGWTHDKWTSLWTSSHQRRKKSSWSGKKHLASEASETGKKVFPKFSDCRESNLKQIRLSCRKIFRVRFVFVWFRERSEIHSLNFSRLLIIKCALHG